MCKTITSFICERQYLGKQYQADFPVVSSLQPYEEQTLSPKSRESVKIAFNSLGCNLVDQSTYLAMTFL